MNTHAQVLLFLFYFTASTFGICTSFGSSYTDGLILGDFTLLGRTKNMVLNNSNLQDDFVVRIGINTPLEGNKCTLRPNNLPLVSNFVKSGANIIFDLMKRSWVLADIDIPSSDEVERELVIASKVASLEGLVYGVNVPVNTTDLCLDMNDYNTVMVICGNTAKQLTQLTSDINIHIETLHCALGSTKDIINEMSVLDRLVFLYGFFSDQIIFKEELDFFHYDAHPGNILYNRNDMGVFRYIWAGHFDQTTHSVHSITKQWKRTLEAIFEIFNGLDVYGRDIGIELCKNSILEEKNILNEQYMLFAFEDCKRDISNFVRTVIPTKINDFYTRISPAVFSDVAKLYNDVEKLKKHNEKLTKQIEKLTKHSEKLTKIVETSC